MNEIIKKELDLSTWELMKSQAKVLIESGFLPKSINTPAKALAIALKGRELGLPMMQSITSIYVIDGKPTVSAELMAALVFMRIPGAILRCIETTDRIATYEAARPGDKILKMSYTYDDAVRAGITSKDNWKKYPAAMLRARCCSAICRVVFPDAIMGLYTPDELGAITTEEGVPVESEGSKEDMMPKALSDREPISEDQRKRLFAIAKGKKTHEEIKEYLATKYNIHSTKDITKDIYDEIIEWVEADKISRIAKDDGRITLKEVLSMIESSKFVTALRQIEPFISELMDESEKLIARQAYSVKLAELKRDE